MGAQQGGITYERDDGVLGPLRSRQRHLSRRRRSPHFRGPQQEIGASAAAPSPRRCRQRAKPGAPRREGWTAPASSFCSKWC